MQCQRKVHIALECAERERHIVRCCSFRLLELIGCKVGLECGAHLGPGRVAQMVRCVKVERLGSRSIDRTLQLVHVSVYEWRRRRGRRALRQVGAHETFE